MNSTNSSINRLSSTMQIVWCVLCGIESLMIITANIVAITIFTKKKFLISKSSYLIINLTVADVLVGVSAFITVFEILYAKENLFTSCRGNFLNNFSMNFAYFTLVASLTSLAMMAFERAFAILFPLRFRRVRSKHYYQAITLSWGISLVVLFKTFCCSSKMTQFKITIELLFDLVTLISFLVIGISYTAIAIKKLFLPGINSSTLMRNNYKLSKTLLLTTVIAFVTWIPGYVVLGIKEKNNEFVADNTGMILAMMVYINSFANLFVYTIRMPRFRQILLGMLGFGRDNKVNSENGRKNVQVTGSA